MINVEIIEERAEKKESWDFEGLNVHIFVERNKKSK